MKPVVHISKTGQGHIQKGELQTNLLMNTDAKILKKIMAN
jgi:hypothetical protein